MSEDKHDVTMYMTPDEIIKAIKTRKYVGKTLFLGGSAFLYTDVDGKRGYDMPFSHKVTAVNMLKRVADWKRFAELKEKEVKVRVHELGNCVFVG